MNIADPVTQMTKVENVTNTTISAYLVISGDVWLWCTVLSRKWDSHQKFKKCQNFTPAAQSQLRYELDIDLT